MNSEMSIADAMALKNDGNGCGNGWGNDIFLIVLFFIFMMNGNGNLFGQHGFGGGATAAAQNEILLGQNFDRVGQKLDGISNGLCNGFYAMNDSLKDCCCENRLGIANLSAQLNEQTCAITTAIHGEADATRAMMRESEIQGLRDKVNDLQRDAALCGMVKLPTTFTYPVNCNPFCGNQNPCGGYNCGGGF